jgi:hypothetical protein
MERNLPAEPEAREILSAFAAKHGLVFEDDGTIGFGRECVGLRHGDSYIDINPIHMSTYEPIADLQDDRLHAPGGVNTYDKHDCLVVLVEDGGTIADAVCQLAYWVQNIDALGEVEIKRYPTGAIGPQAVLTGTSGHCVVIKDG